jgi:hypothetical protein
MQLVAETQETLVRLLPEDFTFGLGTTDQAVPFQDSTRVRCLTKPTAMQSVAETQETPENTFPTVADPRFGVGMTDQAVPFQASAKVRYTVLLWMDEPTATHWLADGHETP